MRRLCVIACAALAALVVSAGPIAAEDIGEWGDAPEGAIAYPFLLPPVLGQFPTCFGVPLAPFVYHRDLCWSHFPGILPPPFDWENDGNAGNCPSFSPYDLDECFGNDAGLMFPDAFTINLAGQVAPCPNAGVRPLGAVCTTAAWGIDIDIMVTNQMPCDGYVNVLMDWDQSGDWGQVPLCPGSVPAPEHVLVNFLVPMGYAGPLSAVPPIGPGGFLIGPRDQFVWSRFTISESPVTYPWDGSAWFEDGETEDYLLQVIDPSPVENASWGVIKGLYH